MFQSETAIMRTLLALVIVYLLLTLLNASEAMVDAAAAEAVVDARQLHTLRNYVSEQELTQNNKKAIKIGMTEVFNDEMLNPVRIQLWANPEDYPALFGETSERASQRENECIDKDAWIYIDLNGITNEGIKEMEERTQQYLDEHKDGIRENLQAQLSSIQSLHPQYTALEERLGELQRANEALPRDEDDTASAGRNAHIEATKAEINRARQLLNAARDKNGVITHTLGEAIHADDPYPLIADIDRLVAEESSYIDSARNIIEALETGQRQGKDILRQFEHLQQQQAQERGAMDGLTQQLRAAEIANRALKNDLSKEKLRGVLGKNKAAFSGISDRLRTMNEIAKQRPNEGKDGPLTSMQRELQDLGGRLTATQSQHAAAAAPLHEALHGGMEANEADQGIARLQQDCSEDIERLKEALSELEKRHLLGTLEDLQQKYAEQTKAIQQQQEREQQQRHQLAEELAAASGLTNQLQRQLSELRDTHAQENALKGAEADELGTRIASYEQELFEARGQLDELEPAKRQIATLSQGMKEMTRAAEDQAAELATVRAREAALSERVESLTADIPQQAEQREELMQQVGQLRESTAALQRDNDVLRQSSEATGTALQREIEQRAAESAAAKEQLAVTKQQYLGTIQRNQADFEAEKSKKDNVHNLRIALEEKRRWKEVDRLTSQNKRLEADLRVKTDENARYQSQLQRAMRLKDMKKEGGPEELNGLQRELRLLEAEKTNLEDLIRRTAAKKL